MRVNVAVLNPYLVASFMGLSMLASMASNSSADVPESSDPIRMALNEWTGQHITTMIAGEVLSRMGYTVEYVTAGYIPQMTALQDNEVTASLEVWLNTIGDNYDKAIESGKVEDLGELGLQSAEGWLYPDYVKDSCPGLPVLDALKACTDLFATAETAPHGRLVDYPADWASHNDERLVALGVNMVPIPAGSEGSLIAEWTSAVQKRQPILMMFWSPHWLFSEYQGEFVQLPEFDAACVDDPAWGANPQAAYDCGWLSGKIRKVAWSGMKDKWPAAHRLLQALTITNEVQIPLMKAIDVDGKDLAESVKAWVDSNENVWRPWVEQATQ